MSAIPVSTPDVVLLAAVATKLEIARTGDRRIEVHDHPLYQRAQRNHCGWVPLLLDELDACTQAVEELREHGGVLKQHAEAAVHQAWTLGAAEMPVVGSGAEMRWTAPADVATAVERAYRRVRGEADVPEPTARTKAPKIYTRPSKRAA